MLLDYSKIKCPKCDKSYFKVRHNYTDCVIDLVYRPVPDPIYKDGVLQNPQPEEASKSYYSCLECGCNFRVESYSDHFDTIDEDAEREAWHKKVDEDNKRRAEELKAKKELTTDSDNAFISGESITAGTGIITLKQNNSVKYVKDIVNDDTLYYKNKKLSDVIEDLRARIAKIEQYTK